MERIESKNVLQAGKVIGTVDRKTYFGNGKRGEKDFVMSRGELAEFNRCPHRWLLGYESEETKSTEWGTLIDCLALSPDEFEESFVVTPESYPDSKTGEAKPWNWNANFCKAWRDEHDGLEVVKHETFTQASNAVKFLMADPEIAEMIRCSQRQVMAVAEYFDEETEITVPLKVLIDLLPDVGHGQFGKSLADLKTCTTAHPFPWSRAVFEHGYFIQAALYLDVYTSATDEDRVDFRHILQESYPPWEVGKRIVSQEFIELGRETYMTALKRYCRCLAENFWPGYDHEGRMILNGWQVVDPEAWMVGR